jgi:hypothetical protein
MCELCEMWFHCKCQDDTDDIYKLLNQEIIHFYFGGCNRAVGKILKSVAELHSRQEKLQMKMKEVGRVYNRLQVVGVLAANRTES